MEAEFGLGLVLARNDLDILHHFLWFPFISAIDLMNFAVASDDRGSQAVENLIFFRSFTCSFVPVANAQ